MLGSLLKAVVGVAVKTPVSLAADVITLGGALTDKRRDTPYTYDALEEVLKNLNDATRPSR